MPDEDEQHEEHHHEMHVDEVPILVRVQAEPASKTAAADKASLTTVQLKGDGSSPIGDRQRILAQQPKRHKTQVIVYGTVGDYIVVGRQRQAGNKQGGRIYVGSGPIPIESESALFINDYNSVSTNDIFVTIIEELYLTP